MPCYQARGVLNLARQFDKSLEILQAGLTKKGDTDTAIQVRSFRESLKDRPEIVEANAILNPQGSAPAAATSRSIRKRIKRLLRPRQRKSRLNLNPCASRRVQQDGKSRNGCNKERPEYYLEQRFT